jgi:hypothetical protein
MARPGSPRRHRLLACLALGLLALAAEIVGIGLIQRLDVGRHVASPGYAHASYYPPLLAATKVGIALLAARLAWRFARARALERAGLGLLSVAGRGHDHLCVSRAGRAAADPGRVARPPRPRLRLELSPRLWAAAFLLTATIYLVQADVEGIAAGVRWPVLAPLLHTSALPVFAVLAVLVALLWSAVSGWLADYEHHARETLARGRRLVSRLRGTLSPRPAGDLVVPAVRFLGSSLRQRPPPLLAP